LDLRRPCIRWGKALSTPWASTPPQRCPNSDKVEVPEVSLSKRPQIYFTKEVLTE
jgi:hypothetical protein